MAVVEGDLDPQTIPFLFLSDVRQTLNHSTAMLYHCQQNPTFDQLLRIYSYLQLMTRHCSKRRRPLEMWAVAKFGPGLLHRMLGVPPRSTLRVASRQRLSSLCKVRL